MSPEFSGIERRLGELSERSARLETLKGRARDDFERDPYLRDIAERNLEVAAQCCIDICNRIIAVAGAQKPADSFEAFLRLGEIGVLAPGFARQFAPVAGFRNVLVHEYVSVDWDVVYAYLSRLEDFETFSAAVREWLRGQAEDNQPDPLA